jgi:hypothetical protein
MKTLLPLRTNYTHKQFFFNKQTLNSVRKYGMECRKENKYVFGFALTLDIMTVFIKGQKISLGKFMGMVSYKCPTFFVSKEDFFRIREILSTPCSCL